MALLLSSALALMSYEMDVTLEGMVVPLARMLVVLAYGESGAISLYTPADESSPFLTVVLGGGVASSCSHWRNAGSLTGARRGLCQPIT